MRTLALALALALALTLILALALTLTLTLTLARWEERLRAELRAQPALAEALQERLTQT